MASRPDKRLSPPKDLSHLLSEETRRRQLSSIKGMYKYFSIPGIGQLAGGLPNHKYFPFDNLMSDCALPDRFRATSSDSHVDQSPKASRLVVPHESGNPDRSRKIDLTTAFQYGTAEGYPPLREWLLDFVVKHYHPDIPYSGGPNIVLTCGSTDGFSKILQAFNNVWVEGRDEIASKEGLLVEEFAYMNAVQTARPRGMNIAPVRIDDEGMCAEGPGGLRDVLENWDFGRGKRPHLMYTVTIGQNPTSGVLSVERRRVIYDICCQYDIIICEDDPYWFLQYPSASGGRKTSNGGRSGYPFLDSLVPSYLSMDTEGRVVRMDTFSKTIAPGCRLGWLTAQPAIIERLVRITEVSTQQPSGFVQSMVAELLVGPPNTAQRPPASPDAPGFGGGADGRGYHHAGWVRWLEGLRSNYERRMNTMCDVLEEGRMRVKSGRRPSLHQLGSRDESENEWTVIEREAAPLYSFQRPRGGMFAWIKVHFENHPVWAKDGLSPEDLSKALWILWTRKPSLILVSPGSIFSPTEELRKEQGWKYFRICFAACEEEELVGLSRRFALGVQRFWAIKDTKTIRDILKSDEDDSSNDFQPSGGMMGFC